MALVAAAVFFVILVEVWVVLFFVGIASFPNGAPVSSCSDLRPFHGARLTGFAIEEILDRPAPYVLKTNRIDSNLYEGVISGTIPFRGFMVQARIDSSQQIVGKFIRFDRDLAKALICSLNDDTITHTNDKLKQHITFVWRLDDSNIPESRIHFVATIAKSYSEFWTNVTSEAITIGSPIKEMTATTSVTQNQSVPEGRLGPENPAKPPLNMQGNQMNHRQRRQQQPPYDRPFLESEELLLPPEIAALIPQLPIPSSDTWQHQTFVPGELLAPTGMLEPKTTSTQNPFVSLFNTSLVQEDPNLPAETTGDRPSQNGLKNHPSTVQLREQHITDISRSLKLTTPGSVDATRINRNSIGASNNPKFCLLLHSLTFTLIFFWK